MEQRQNSEKLKQEITRKQDEIEARLRELATELRGLS